MLIFVNHAKFNYDNNFFQLMIILGLIWSHDGSKLHVFTMDGNNWTLEVTKNNGLRIDDELTNCINEVLVNIIEEQELKDEEEELSEGNDEDAFIDDNMDDDVEMNNIDNDDDDWLEKEPIFLGVDGSCNGIFAVIIFWYGLKIYYNEKKLFGLILILINLN